MVITFDGVEYEIESLELGELEWLEEDLGQSVDEIHFGSARAVVRIVWLFRKRTNPDLTLDDIRKMPMSALVQSDDADDAPAKKKPAAKARPTRQRRK